MGSRPLNVIGSLTLCLFVAVSLTGCGKKGEAGKASVAKKTSSVQTQKKEVPVPSNAPITEERTFYDFENDLNGWEIPMWAIGKSDHVAKDMLVSKEFASKGDTSMKIMADFPGGIWSATLVEIQQYLDLSSYRVISVDIYLPAGAPIGLNAKIILTVGSNWKFVEMSRSFPLIPGEWLKVTANIEPGSYDWKRVVPDEAFAQDIRKIAVRIESNRKPKYTGPIYIDNVRAGR